MRKRTPQEVRFLRRHATTLPAPEIARRLGRGRDQIYRWARQLGIKLQCTRKAWTPQEEARLRRLYGTAPAHRLARHFPGRAPGTLHQHAAVLGLSRPTPQFSAADLATLRRLHAAGQTCTEIGKAVKHERHQVAKHLRRLGLKPHPYQVTPGWRASNAAQRQRQKTQLGITDTTQLRTLGFRRYARQQGWPEDLRPRSVQILDWLWTHGPQTRRQIAAGLGLPWRGSRASRKSNDPEGSYLAHLMARGLVVRLGRMVRDGPTAYHRVHVYTLSLTTQKGMTDGQAHQTCDQ